MYGLTPALPQLHLKGKEVKILRFIVVLSLFLLACESNSEFTCKTMNTDDEKRHLAELNKFIAELDSGNYEAAQRIAAAVSSADRCSYFGMYMRAIIEFERHEYDGRKGGMTEKELSAGIKLHMDAAKIANKPSFLYHSLGGVMASLEKHDEAIGYFEKAIDTEKDNKHLSKITRKLAASAMAINKPDVALAALNETLQRQGFLEPYLAQDAVTILATHRNKEQLVVFWEGAKNSLKYYLPQTVSALCPVVHDELGATEGSLCDEGGKLGSDFGGSPQNSLPNQTNVTNAIFNAEFACFISALLGNAYRLKNIRPTEGVDSTLRFRCVLACMP